MIVGGQVLDDDAARVAEIEAGAALAIRVGVGIVAALVDFADNASFPDNASFQPVLAEQSQKGILEPDMFSVGAALDENNLALRIALGDRAESGLHT